VPEVITLRNIAMALLLIVAALAVTKSPASSDTVRDSLDRGARAVCAVQPLRPARQGGQVVATGEFRCDRPGPEKLTFAVHLLRSSDGRQWTTVASQTFTAAGLDTTGARSASERRRTVGAACSGGTASSWRTAVEWTLQDRGRTTNGSHESEPRKPC
jgi:hypothetical protein